MQPSPTPFELKRVTALIGPYGSGKTELALGLARILAEASRAAGAPQRTMVGDLDVLKPYFRSREAGERLKEAGVGLLAPAGALAASDLPILTPELRGNVLRADTRLILDVGGDPVGARALGSISDVVSATEYDLLLVLNRYRPFMDSAARVVEQARQMAAAAHLSITGVISNTHMLDGTTAADVTWGLELAREVAATLGLSLRLLAVPEHLENDFAHQPGLPPLVVIRRQMKPHFLGGVVLAPPPAPARSIAP